MKKIIEKIGFVLLCLAIFFGVQVTFATAIVSGESMHPTYEDRDVVLGVKIDRNYARQDVVIVDCSQYNIGAEYIIKRVIAVAGDTVAIMDGYLYINGEKQEESYISEQMYSDMEEVTVSQDCVFVMGDNRNNSIDSRIIGEINVEDVYAKVVYENDFISSLFHKLYNQ